MTTVRLALLAPTGDPQAKRPTGSLEWRPTKRRNVAGDVVLPAAFSRGLTDPPTTVDVDPTEPGWAWQVVERVSGGSPRARYVLVPDTDAVVDYADLQPVDPATLEPTEEPEAAWWAMANALVAGQGLVALDTDGTPYYDPAGVTQPVTIRPDTDGVLFFVA